MLIFRALAVSLLCLFLFPVGEDLYQKKNIADSTSAITTAITSASPNSLIRFHVVANSDSEYDQSLKRAVRDAILSEVSPRLAASHSLDDSRRLLQELKPEMEKIAQGVVEEWGENYRVRADYGKFIFPTKSYGSLILPAGEYEAVRILIGQAEGSNWWCVLFPPLCFVDIEHSTAVPVDGKPGIPIRKDGDNKPGSQSQKAERPQVKFWIWEKIKGILESFNS